MKILYFDCFSGISGDMTIGALLSLGIDHEQFRSELNKISLDGFHVTIKDVVKNGISATDFDVHIEAHDHHDHDHEHSHGRHLTEILDLIEKSTISENAKSLSKKIFNRLAQAEAKVHHTTPEQVHFHEVGAVDSIVDIIGAAICIDLLSPDKICASIINDGYGFTHCAHGKIPIPVPAVLEIFSNASVQFRQINVDKELVTPTGAAIIAELAESFSLCPSMNVTKTGYGAGKRNNEMPNVLRVMLGETIESSEEITIIETNIDDCSPEILSYTMEKLLKNGAHDVFFTPIYMKKNRPSVMMTVLCAHTQLDTMKAILFSETTTIGMRYHVENRFCLPRTFRSVSTKYGDVDVKCVRLHDGEKTYVEFETAKALAEKSNVPIHAIYAEVQGLLKDKNDYWKENEKK